MNCQEVMELMQRHLDLDLNESEQKALMDHLRQCPDCAEMFERLRQLSQELASLPKVSPPFSLVDSILPQLEEIDRRGEGPLSAASIGGRSAAASPASPRVGGERPRRFRAGWTAALGGIVAAGVLLALFIQDMDGKQVADESALLPSAGNAASSSAAGNNTPMSKAEDDRSSSQEVARGQATDVRDMSNAQRNMQMASPEADPQPETFMADTKKRASDPGVPAGEGSGSANAVGGGKPAGTEAAGRSAAEAGKSDGKATEEHAAGTSMGAPGSAAVPPQGAADASEGAGADKSAEPEQAPDTGQTFDVPANDANSASGQDNPPLAVQEAPEAAQDGNSAGPQFGFSAAEDDGNELKSEDGLLIATVDPVIRRVIVKTVGERQMEMFVSAAWGEQEYARLLQWQGSAKLTYSITSADGSVRTMIVDIAKQTEAEQP